MKYIQLLFVLLLVSLSFSSLLWQLDIRGEPKAAPIVFQDKVAVLSNDGNVYAINTATGKTSWKTAIVNASNLLEYNGKLIILTSDARVAAVDKDGKTAWTVDLKKLNISNVTTTYGAGKNSRGVYVATDAGIFRLGENTATPYYLKQARYGKPTATDNFLIFAEDTKMIKADLTGKVLWSHELNDYTWKSYPVISGQMIYFGGLDNRLHALSTADGSELWAVPTGGWVLTPPLVTGDDVYFASNDGYVYSVNPVSGDIEWKTKVRLAVVAQPEAGIIGGEQVIFVGSTDGNAYAMKQDTGEIVWKSAATDRVEKPIFDHNKVILASYDKSVYAYDTERACSIEIPVEGDKVGFKEVVVTGKSVSNRGGQQVFISINSADWVETNVSETGNWFYYLDPQTVLQEGINAISCRVVDMDGSEEGFFTNVNFIRDSTIKLDDFIITVPNTPYDSEAFEIYVNSKSDGSPVDRFTLKISGKSYTGDKKVNVTAAGGRQTIEVTKLGYNAGTAQVDVASKEINPLYLAGGAILLLIVLWQLYVQVISKMLVKK
ncbi:MAG: PQQ-binding-like beta-propeller repeat protein [Candidatus Micrarchaeota archaeon]